MLMNVPDSQHTDTRQTNLICLLLGSKHFSPEASKPVIALYLGMMHTDALMTWENRRLLSRSCLLLPYFHFEVAPASCTEVICAANCFPTVDPA